MSFEEFKKEARHKKECYIYDDTTILFEQIPTALSGDIEFGNFISIMKYSRVNNMNMLIESDITENTFSKIIRFSDEKIDEFKMSDIFHTSEHLEYFGIASITKATTTIKNGLNKQSTIIREMYVCTDLGGEYNAKQNNGNINPSIAIW